MWVQKKILNLNYGQGLLNIPDDVYDFTLHWQDLPLSVKPWKTHFALFGVAMCPLTKVRVWKFFLPGWFLQSLFTLSKCEGFRKESNYNYNFLYPACCAWHPGSTPGTEVALAGPHPYSLSYSRTDTALEMWEWDMEALTFRMFMCSIPTPRDLITWGIPWALPQVHPSLLRFKKQNISPTVCIPRWFSDSETKKVFLGKGVVTALRTVIGQRRALCFEAWKTLVIRDLWGKQRGKRFDWEGLRRDDKVEVVYKDNW